MSLTDEMQNRLAKYWDKRGKIKLWSGVIGNQSLQKHVQRQAKNQEAEDSYVRRKAWEDQPGMQTATGEDMGHTILGDVTNPTPIVINSQPQGSGIGKVLAGAAIAAGLIGIPGAGIAGYAISQMLNRPEAVTPAPTSPNTTVDIGLGRFEDLFPSDGTP